MRKSLAAVVAVLIAAGALTLPVAAGAAAAAVPIPGVWVASAGLHQVTWSWSKVPGATGYKVAFSRSSTMASPSFSTLPRRWATRTNLTPGQSYYLAVRAITADGTSGPSKIVRGVAGAVPKPNGAPKPDFDFCDWRWNPYAGAAKYLVQQSTTPTFKVNVIAQVVTGRRVELPVERDSWGYLRVKPLSQAGVKISATWSLIGACFVPYHPVVDPTT